MATDRKEDLELIQEIEHHILTVGNFGIDPRIFHILDDLDSTEAQIAGIEKMLRDHGLIAIKSPMPDIRENLETTIGLKVSEYFHLIGIGSYLRVVPVDRR